MRWWVAGWLVGGVLVLAACGTSAGGGAGAGGPTGSPSTEPSTGAPVHTSASPSTAPSSTRATSPSRPGPSASATTPSGSAGGCVSGHAEVTAAPGGAPGQRLCARPGTVLSLVLRPRADGKRWTAVRSSAPVFVLASGWRVDADGTARATLRCASTRAGAARVTALAKEPDVAGAARVAFTVDVSVVPHPKEG
ncbi:hypothetical protein ABZ915_14515 [Streptomyces sp. NPDC046915]|uniref:hypothetical protein n=1 Tax=Streptomyces sp. NPDC046915 TaxID=3155257 RepID=UPI0033C7AAC0